MKLPPQSKKVFTGEIFDVYHWQQEMFDGTTETFEMLKRPDTLQIIPVIGNKILIAREEQPNKPLFTGLLGGRRDGDENPLAGAQRELREETGCESDNWELYRSFEPYTKMDWNVHIYIARQCEKKYDPMLDAGERITVDSVSFEEFLDIVISPDFYGQEFAHEILSNLYKHPEKIDAFKKQLFV